MNKRIDFMPVYAALATLDKLACSLNIGPNGDYAHVWVFDHDRPEEWLIVFDGKMHNQADANSVAGRIIRREWES